MKQTKMLRSRFALFALSLVCCAASLFVQTLFVQTLFVQTSFAQTTPAQTTSEPQLSSRDAATQQAVAASASFDQVIDRAVEREHFFMAEMKHLHPLVETYLQNLKQDKDIDAPVPTSDVYFLGRLDMSDGTDDRAFYSPTTAGLGKRMLNKLSNVYSMKFLPLGFAKMLFFDKIFHLNFSALRFVRASFSARCAASSSTLPPRKTP